ncbi:Non-structural maintenance of chromosomes element 4 like protein A [Eufriesea mexicana]|uniref:Non-structural maintenance of chromosomes element 4 n=1 Tax=Eufriesea mexicana TaxID=516756 RepID=A0A310SLE0_9HYME|nr:PREDICTED: non-structural maintenance of chromosomes element 4 homolog A [Eufriesea mexicana]OAD57319.1 Non-structural maintenance of chromosomes element 4 like protein A [Eufriesea mexicana]
MSKINYNSEKNSPTSRSPQERKEILRKIITRAQSLQNTINDDTIQTLELCMEQTDSINSETSLEEKVHNQEEVLMDSEMMNISSRVLKHCTKSLTKLVCAYNHVEFAQKLVKYIKELPDVEPETPDWSLLESQVTKCFKRTPQYSTLLGTLAPLEKKEVNRKKPVVREAQVQIKRPDNIVTAEKEEESLEETVKINKFISKYYKTHHKPLDFFKLILHPNDFGKTIQNILQISFLVRDGKVKVSKDASGILVVQPCTKDMIAQLKAGKTSNVQNVIYLNMEQWKILKNIYQLEKPMIECDTEILHVI